MREVEAVESAVTEINAAAEDVLGGFFKAALASQDKPEWKLELSKQVIFSHFTLIFIYFH